MKKCPKCGLRHDNSVEVCDCGYNLTMISGATKSSGIAAVGSTETSRSSSNNYSPDSLEKYPALRTFAGLYRLLAVGAGILALVAALFAISESLLVAFSMLILGAISSISLLAIAEGIQVLIDIEANTRKSAARNS